MFEQLLSLGQAVCNVCQTATEIISKKMENLT